MTPVCRAVHERYTAIPLRVEDLHTEGYSTLNYAQGGQGVYRIVFRLTADVIRAVRIAPPRDCHPARSRLEETGSGDRTWKSMGWPGRGGSPAVTTNDQARRITQGAAWTHAVGCSQGAPRVGPIPGNAARPVIEQAIHGAVGTGIILQHDL
jgi:hypothetical protein